MKLAVTEAPPATAALDEQLVSRLMFQRIILLGTEVDDRVANRLCAQLLLLRRSIGSWSSAVSCATR